jgi:hypothetical protein
VTTRFKLLGGGEQRLGGGDCAWRVCEARVRRARRRTRVRKAARGHVHRGFGDHAEWGDYSG